HLPSETLRPVSSPCPRGENEVVEADITFKAVEIEFLQLFERHSSACFPIGPGGSSESHLQTESKSKRMEPGSRRTGAPATTQRRTVAGCTRSFLASSEVVSNSGTTPPCSSYKSPGVVFLLLVALESP